MSNIGCNCAEQTLAHLGRPSCVFKIGQTRRIAFMHRLKSDGTRNYIDLSGGTFDNAFWQALLTHQDPRQRLYLTQDLENVTHPNQERVVETFSSGYMAETRPAFLGFEGFMVDANATSPASKQLAKMKCSDLVFFYVDVTGALIGDASEWSQGKLYGIPVMRGSFDNERMLATDDATGKLKIGFMHDFYKFHDGNMGGVAGNLQDVSLLNVSPVLPVNGVVSTPTGTGFTVTLTTDFIAGLGFAPITGLVAADFVLTTSAGAPVVITSVTEGNDGVYAVVATLAAGNYLVGIDIDSHIMTPVAFTVAP
jgi:hypothetical protein